MNPDITNFLGITGKVNIEQPLKIDTDYQFTGVISVYGKNRSSKQDGTYNDTYKAKFFDEIHLIQGDEIIRGEKKVSKSQKMRKMIYAMGHDYDEVMDYLLGGALENVIYDYEHKPD